jgi:hypothetical protein
MLIPCHYSGCGDRRRHWCDPYTPRGQQQVEVPLSVPSMMAPIV